MVVLVVILKAPVTPAFTRCWEEPRDPGLHVDGEVNLGP